MRISANTIAVRFVLLSTPFSAHAQSELQTGIYQVLLHLLSISFNLANMFIKNISI